VSSPDGKRWQNRVLPPPLRNLVGLSSAILACREKSLDRTSLSFYLQVKAPMMENLAFLAKRSGVGENREVHSEGSSASISKLGSGTTPVRSQGFETEQLGGISL